MNWFVGVIENAVQETEPVGIKPHIEQRQKYTLDQLLAPDFRLPNPKEKRRQVGGELAAMFGHRRKKKRKTTGGFDLPSTIAVQYEAMLSRKLKKL